MEGGVESLWYFWCRSEWTGIYSSLVRVHCKVFVEPDPEALAWRKWWYNFVSYGICIGLVIVLYGDVIRRNSVSSLISNLFVFPICFNLFVFIFIQDRMSKIQSLIKSRTSSRELIGKEQYIWVSSAYTLIVDFVMI